MQGGASCIERAAARHRPFQLRTALALVALAVGAGLVQGPRRYRASVPQFLPGQSSDEQSYYAGAYAITDLPVADLVADLPELQGLQPAAGQEPLPAILSQAGASVKQAYQDITSVALDEQITQEQFGYNQRIQSTARHQFSYLIIASHEDGNETLQEYRTDARMKPVESLGFGEGFPFTKDFASMWVLFYPENQPEIKCRYLGQQTSDGRNRYLVCFAERPGGAVVTGRFDAQGRSALLLYQGVAWIDAASFRIVRMRLDLLEPRLDVALERQTTDIQFGEVRIPKAPEALWLPEEVVVTTVYNGQLFRNRHRYSNFRLFVVKHEITPAEPEQPRAPN